MTSRLVIPFILLTAFFVIPLQMQAVESNSDWQIELKSIDAELEQLKVQLHEERMDAMNADILAQPDMFDSWHEFADGIRHSENAEKEVGHIKKKIHVLEDRKEALLKSHPLQTR